MNDDTFVFLDEFLDTELYIFLNKCKEKILKFVWKDKNIEIIGKYQEKLESCYNTELQLEVLFDLAEIGYDAVVYKVLSKIEEEYFEWLDFGDWNDCLSIKENINKEHMDIINEKNKKLEELKRKGREYLKYLDELEILRREGVNTPKREEELIKKIKEREEIGKKYAEYKRNLKKWIKSLKDKEIMNLLIN